MILYTDEARRSWKQLAGQIRSKLVSNKELESLEAEQLRVLLGMFCDYVDKEAKDGEVASR